MSIATRQGPAKSRSARAPSNGSEASQQIEDLYEIELPEPYSRSVMVGQLWLPIEALIVDQRYQRTINETRCERYAAKWSWALSGLMTVSDRGKIQGKDSFAILDGQHRARALHIRHEPKAWCEVFFGLTNEEEAFIFRERNRRRVATSAIDDFRAALAHKDPQALRVHKVLEGLSLEVGVGAKDPQMLQSKSALFSLDDWGVLQETLVLIRRTWPKTPRAKERTVLLGVGMWLWNLDKRVDGKRFQEIFEAEPLAAMIGNAREMRATLGQREWEHFARVICKMYDKGRPAAQHFGAHNLRVPTTGASTTVA